MAVTVGSAPGKSILLGEHAVVYDRPAIAIPVTQVHAKAFITPLPKEIPGTVQLEAPDINLHTTLDRLSPDNPFVLLLTKLTDTLNIRTLPAFKLRVKSTIPIASGLGSGAAISVAIIRAVSAFLGHPLPDEQVSALTLLTEKHYHGTPSGIDNTVITYNQPIYFIRGKPFELLQIPCPFTLVIANSGIKSSTAESVGDVRRWVQSEPARYEHIFDEIASLVNQSRALIEQGEPLKIGALMTQNHALLQQIGVSSPALDGLVQTALTAGALGAKLSGGGRGGNIIALVEPDSASGVAAALRTYGAVDTLITTVNPTI
jgi:mevalonate kinase